MPLESLEALRLLSNLETEKRKLLQVVLFGQPELDDKLARLRPAPAAPAHRLPVPAGRPEPQRARLLPRAPAARRRLRRPRRVLAPRAIKRLHRASGGTPRLVNILAHKALLAVFGEGGGAGRAAPRPRRRARSRRRRSAPARLARLARLATAMSLINQVLQDLDRRQGSAPALPAARLRVVPQAEDEPRRMLAGAVGAALVVVAVVVASALVWRRVDAHSAPSPAPMAAMPAPAPATAIGHAAWTRPHGRCDRLRRCDPSRFLARDDASRRRGRRRPRPGTSPSRRRAPSLQRLLPHPLPRRAPCRRRSPRAIRSPRRSRCRCNSRRPRRRSRPPIAPRPNTGAASSCTSTRAPAKPKRRSPLPCSTTAATRRHVAHWRSNGSAPAEPATPSGSSSKASRFRRSRRSSRSSWRGSRPSGATCPAPSRRCAARCAAAPRRRRIRPKRWP